MVLYCTEAVNNGVTWGEDFNTRFRLDGRMVHAKSTLICYLFACFLFLLLLLLSVQVNYLEGCYC